MKSLLFFLIFVSTAAFSQQQTRESKFSGYRLLDIEYFDVKYQEFQHNRDPYAPEYDGRWAYRASANFRLNLFESFYWDNNVHTEAIQSGTVKTVGWHWEAGLRISESIDIFHEHHSRHVMEEDRPTRGGGNVF